VPQLLRDIMSTQNRTIIGAAEYCLHSIQNLKKGMLDIGSPNQKVAMAVGGLIVTMTSNLLHICQDVIEDAAQSHQPDAKADLKRIQSRFNEFLTQMIGE